MEIDTLLRLGIFLTVLVVMAVWEIVAPKRKQAYPKDIRFINNIGFMAVNSLVLRIVFPIGASGFAIWCQSNSVGVLNLIEIPLFVEIILAIIVLDLVIYFQHILFHRLPILWRLHKVHHADPEIDVSTAGRFHTFEIIISMVIKLAAISIIGPSAFAVLMFEILLNACAMFNHSNIAMPKQVDTFLRKFVVTPDMHRIHHSNNPREFNSNFGFNISLWDKVFKTYIDEPKLGQVGMIIGQSETPAARDLWIDKLFLRVFKH